MTSKTRSTETSDVVIGQCNTAARQQQYSSSIIFLPANHTLLSLVSCMVNSYTSKFAMTVTAEISRTRLIRRIPSILDYTNVTAFPPAQHSHGFVVIYVVS